jgi:subtilisin family serine protease
MKSIVRYCILLSVFLASFATYSQDQDFYYYKNKKIYMDVDYSRLSIVSEDTITTDMFKDDFMGYNFKMGKGLKSVTGKSVKAFDKKNRNYGDTCSYITEIEFYKSLSNEEYLKIINKLQAKKQIVKVYPSFKSKNNPVRMSNIFYVRLSKADDIQTLEELADKYSITILGNDKYMPLWYSLSCTKKTPFNALKGSQILYESGKFQYCEPEFFFKIDPYSNDPEYEHQWGLKNTGFNGGKAGIDINIENAWALTTGHPDIKVAIFDYGFEMDHPDLVDNVYGTGYDATSNTSPSVIHNYHGTFCAGIVGAKQNNNEGISGVAPDCKLVSISCSIEPNSAQLISNGFNWACNNNIDVINASWGWTESTYSSYLEESIENCLNYGRDGKGIVVVFAAGNGNPDPDSIIGYPGSSNPDILVVGAVDRWGKRKRYDSQDGQSFWASSYGSELDVIAPGISIYTTDRQGYNGIDPQSDYYAGFSGTSAACPHVAGLAALLLSRDPNLTAAEVRNIIESTARKLTDDYSYWTENGRINGQWNDETGYGLIDAYAALSSICPTLDYFYELISNNTDYIGCTINIEDVIVDNNSHLNIRAERLVKIAGPFEVPVGCSLDIQVLF